MMINMTSYLIDTLSTPNGILKFVIVCQHWVSPSQQSVDNDE